MQGSKANRWEKVTNKNKIKDQKQKKGSRKRLILYLNICMLKLAGKHWKGSVRKETADRINP